MAKRSRAGSASPEPEANQPHTGAAASEPAAPHVVKYVHVDSADASRSPTAVMECQLPGHAPLEFATYEDYDVHYHKTHVNRCSECRKNFPSDLILGLHFAEVHDPINDARKARGEKIYACFAEDCDKKCSTPAKRRMHMVAKHQFPEEYDFAIIKDGINGRSSMLRSSRKDIYTRNSNKPAAGKARAKAEMTKADEKKSAKTHIIFNDDGSTPQSTQLKLEQTQEPSDAMDVVCPTSDDPSVPNTVQDVEMVSHENEHPSGLSASKHATKLPPSTLAKDAQQKGKEKDVNNKGEQHGDTTGIGNARDGAVFSPRAVDDVSDAMEGLTKSMSSLKFVPPSIRFGRGGGRGKGRGGFAKG
ncbi:c2h2 type zinc finger domain protein [Diplodia corticola]|uniref:C2h2 type zinc finger domain protein n=1 Tax=Diplodia corticola TaxID=236234 RepID=A0A1J9RE87_9PEZI|nr:c2h2 type zinc finger domain protein [Diplodia corticola]OJD30867.1 c2h2 type zinc finger domain protein [Diplodia corticola]